MTGRYLEEFAPGQKFASGQLKVDRERIKSFAAEFDPQPFHLNEEAARGSVFKGLAASGWHTAAMTMRLLVESELKPVCREFLIRVVHFSPVGCLSGGERAVDRRL